MVLKSLRLAVLAAAVLIAWGLAGSCSSAQDPCCPPPAGGGLFANYYAQPGVPASLYPAPRPTPPFVGHTYITYEALYPHEFLYRHHRVYETNHADGGLTRTRVHWR